MFGIFSPFFLYLFVLKYIGFKYDIEQVMLEAAMDQQAIQDYLLALVKERHPLLMEMEDYAREQHVPIMDLLGMEHMLQFLRLIQPKKILELGAAIGYSSIRMVQSLSQCEVVTIERNVPRIEKAKEYIAKAGLTHQITLIEGDALLSFEEVQKHGTFDVIFIDAAKGQYKRFFELYEPLLNDNGVIISDNVLFHGEIVQYIENKRRRCLVNKIKDYNEWLSNHPKYDTTIFPIGDGVTVSKKKG
ncbi:putative O-methyltransferase YrrM [Priestia taiwanensis]|uniref:tRNA 5-hydroxyuridine methyltransferase n=2 Tax=Priestia taiwanensis TaxID=1347902 RepID=A0A917AUB8_9BACI|nr:putative O-methyltransferase YrrM [Priestia taiwanensis]GGE74936.1 SAM-dependent methyltransferase [Priestia taiwanensis]